MTVPTTAIIGGFESVSERALIGTRPAEARRILGAINGATTFKHRTD